MRINVTKCQGCTLFRKSILYVGLGIKLIFSKLLLRMSIYQVQCIINDKQIWLNPGAINKRLNFTLSHELGHILLKHAEYVSDGMEYDTRNSITNPEKKDRR